MNSEKIGKLIGGIGDDEVFSKKTVYNRDILEAIRLLVEQNKEILHRQEMTNGKLKLHTKLIFALYGIIGTVFSGVIISLITGGA